MHSVDSRSLEEGNDFLSRWKLLLILAKKGKGESQANNSPESSQGRKGQTTDRGAGPQDSQGAENQLEGWFEIRS